MKPQKNIARGGRKSATDEEVVQSVAWEDLLARAEAALDEKGIEAQKRRENSAKKIQLRMEERGIKPGWDIEGVHKALAAYYADCVLGTCAKGFRKIFAECGVRSVDFYDAREVYPELRLVYEYVVRRRNELAQTEAEELARQAQAAQKRLVTEEGCDLNQKAVEFSLKATMKGIYGDSEAEKDASKRKPIVYKFENLTANFIMSPGELAAKKLDGATPVSEVIDV